jgi:hypothetical protein
MSPRRSSQRLAAVLVSLIVLAHRSSAVGQDTPYTPALLTTIRREAHALPGPRPRDLRYLVVAEAPLRLDMVVADASPDAVTRVFPVFQIRFADRWIMVDAALDCDPLGLQPDASARAEYTSAELRRLHETGALCPEA